MRLLRTRCPDRMFFGPYGPPFSREGRNIPIFFIALRSSGSFGHAGLLSELPEFAGFLSRRGCPVAAAHGLWSRCVHLTRHSEPGFRRFVPAPGLLRLSAARGPLRLPSAPVSHLADVPVFRSAFLRCPVAPDACRSFGFRRRMCGDAGSGRCARRRFPGRRRVCGTIFRMPGIAGLPCLTGCGGARFVEIQVKLLRR